MNRIFRADDGTEIAEEDIRKLLVFDVNAIADVREALAPKTCGAVIHTYMGDESPTEIACVLPPGHHPFEVTGKCCSQNLDDPIHSPGHLAASEHWTES